MEQLHFQIYNLHRTYNKYTILTYNIFKDNFLCN